MVSKGVDNTETASKAEAMGELNCGGTANSRVVSKGEDDKETDMETAIKAAAKGERASRGVASSRVVIKGVANRGVNTRGVVTRGVADEVGGVTDVGVTMARKCPGPSLRKQDTFMKHSEHL